MQGRRYGISQLMCLDNAANARAPVWDMRGTTWALQELLSNRTCALAHNRGSLQVYGCPTILWLLHICNAHSQICGGYKQPGGRGSILEGKWICLFWGDSSNDWPAFSWSLPSAEVKSLENPKFGHIRLALPGHLCILRGVIKGIQGSVLFETIASKLQRVCF